MSITEGPSLNAAWYFLDYEKTDDGNGDISCSLSIQAKKHPDISRDLTRPGFTNTVIICCAGFEDYDKMCIPASTTPQGTCSEGEQWDDAERCKHATAAIKLMYCTDNTRLEIYSTVNQLCAQFSHCPKILSAKAIKTIASHLRGTRDKPYSSSLQKNP
jgi:hypothetical protein